MDVSPVLVWFLVGVFFFVTELILPGFILFFLGVGAWCAAAVLAALHVPLTVQLLIFLISSLASLLLLRTKFRSIFIGDSSRKEASPQPAPITGVVLDAILPPAEGRVKYGGSSWRAVADEPTPEGAVVLVVEKRDLIVKVKALHAGKEEEK